MKISKMSKCISIYIDIAHNEDYELLDRFLEIIEPDENFILDEDFISITLRSLYPYRKKLKMYDPWLESAYDALAELGHNPDEVLMGLL